MGVLEYWRLADGPGGDARLTAYRLMRQAHGVFPWDTVVADFRRRDYRSQAAREVFFKVEESAKYGFVLRQPCGSYYWKPDASWVMPADSTAVARGPAGRHAGLSPQGADGLSFRISFSGREVG